MRRKHYIELGDGSSKWKQIAIHPHKFRHSLVFEMRKAQLGLPFITYQLKHHFNCTNGLIVNTTLSYANLGTDGVRKAIEDANSVAMHELYHPDSPVAGGGAGLHKKRREAYFAGIASAGMTIDEAFQKLMRDGGIPLIDVGLGYCQGQMRIEVEGVESDPPCIGGLRCNPVRCSNAVIPAHKLPNWKKSLSENEKRVVDPDYAYADSYLSEAIEEATTVIKILQNEKEER